MIGMLLWILLFIFCWPAAVLMLVLFPIVWLLSLPFRIVGLVIGGLLATLRAILFLPARLLDAAGAGGGRRRHHRPL